MLIKVSPLLPLLSILYLTQFNQHLDLDQAGGSSVPLLLQSLDAIPTLSLIT